MKAAYYLESGGPDALYYGSVPDPALAEDAVLIRVEYISVEGMDMVCRYLAPLTEEQHVAGCQAAGTVEALGGAVTGFRVGDRVVGFNFGGSHAELFAAPQGSVWHVPEGLDLALAAVIPLTFGTAHECLHAFGQVRPGMDVLIHGATLGVGIAAVQLGRAAGARLTGTALGDDRLARIAPLGLDHAIDYRGADKTKRLREITFGKGFDLVVDSGTGMEKDSIVAGVRPGARYAVAGVASPKTPQFGYFELISHGLTVSGITIAHAMHTPRGHAVVSELLESAARGEIEMPIEHEFALCEAEEAHRFVMEGHPFGRVVMRP
ncbi:quinone oxidoreductase family protein [Novosphingobium pentaromativorans]|uniref:quinone oxidoreductase family protein n=1 Tax=Novosphingobium pentaromativorans TaxID=205844 RepID=UPI00051F6ADF|nr:zinc-binding alcohol dehydrogenase family protein [Novosphingobium pentaromativorans]AIT81089.1 alcohol dehydrogenase [Novosphingobium pentaromativorans US6-1]